MTFLLTQAYMSDRLLLDHTYCTLLPRITALTLTEPHCRAAR